MKHLIFILAVFVIALAAVSVYAEIILEEFVVWPDQLDEGGALGIDVVEYDGDVVILVAAEGNGVAMFAEDEDGDMVFLDSWADPEDWSDSYGVDAIVNDDGLTIYFADGMNGLNVVRPDDDMELVFVNNWAQPDDWEDPYSDRVAVLEHNDQLLIFQSEEINGVVALTVQDDGEIIMLDQWMDEEEENGSVGIAAMVYNDEVYVFVGDEEIGLIVLNLDDEGNLIELDRWTDFDPDVDEVALGVKAIEYQEEILIAVSASHSVKTFTINDDGEIQEEGNLWLGEDESDLVFLDMVEFEDDYYILLANGWVGFEIIYEDDGGDLASYDRWNLPQEADEILDVAYLLHEGEFYLYLTSLEHGLFVLSVSEFSRIPEIAVDTDTVQFLEVAVSASEELDFTIRNNGTGNLIVSDILVEGDYFSTDFEGETDIDPEDFLEVTVTFAPEDIGDFTATLTINSNDPENGNVTITVSGIGTAAIGVDPDTLDFGEIMEGESEDLTLIISNGGGVNLTVSDILVEGDYFSTNFENDIVIEPDDNYELIVSFAPEVIGHFAGTLTITSNFPDGYESVVSLNGIGSENAVGETRDNPIPDKYSLSAVYPNPFNPETTVQIALPQASKLSITVFNTLGQQVAIPANGSFPAGFHQFTFNADELSSGIYFIHASVPGKLNDVRKVVLMK